MPPMKRLPTVMSAGHKFSVVPSANIERSVFDRSHGHKLTFDSGLLIPVLVDEVLPGDTLTLRMQAFARMCTPVKPLMDNLYLDSFFFFVPCRLVWSNWVKFMGEQVNPGDSIAFNIPSIAVPFTPAVHSLMDYMGIMTQATATPIQTPNAVNSLPLRAYYLIYDQWFRDENLVNSIGPSTGDGPDSFAGTNLPLKRAKRHDYFTSCLPFLQKGTAVGITPTGVIPVVMAGVTGETAAIQNAAGAARNLEVVGAPPSPVVMDSAGGGIPLTVNLSGLTVNDLRLSFQLQKLLERDARGGTRYTEIIWSHFRVKSPDARLQRAEYLGGGSTPVVVSPVAQTAPPATTPTDKNALAALGATGAVFASGHGFTKSFTEHGYLIGIINVRADLTYSQGLEKLWSRRTRYDFYWPALAHIGEQAVKSKEIWFDGTTAANAADEGVFGYQERYAEYRYKPSRISGVFRPNAVASLFYWHLSEKFATRPTLGVTFIEDQTETVLDDRVLVPAEPDWYADIYFNYICARPMPVFGVPGFIDHF